ncbi:MAG: branched-chain amino acid ABC transporter substrate-binding protein [Chloroflexi bacterium]|nr:branched-chain amino acid ABC transporter substrate-binding protein [Chloroflexota bacterium]
MKLRKLGAIAAIGAIAFAGCTTGPAGFTPPADELGVITVGPNDPVHLAYWGVLSGGDASLGQDSLYGAQVAVDDKGGKILDHNINLTSEDAQCTVDGGAAAGAKLAADNTIVALIGSACSDETVGGIKAISDAGLTTVSPSATRPALTAPDRAADYAGFTRTAHSDAFQGQAVAEFVFNELKLTKAATIHDGSAYAEALQQVFADEFTALGGEIVIQEQVGKDTTDMTPVLTRVAGAGPEVVYFPIFVQAGGYIAAQAKDVPGLANAALIGSDGMFTPDFVEAAGPAAEGMYLSSPNFSAFQAGYADFLPKYEAKAGSAPLSAFHAHSYDAFNIIYAAIEKVAVKGSDGTLYIGKKALRDAIYATKDLQGLTGVLSCSASGDCGAPLIALYQITAREVGGEWPPEAPVWPTE